jgi:hypothetical protein
MKKEQRAKRGGDGSPGCRREAGQQLQGVSTQQRVKVHNGCVVGEFGLRDTQSCLLTALVG